MDEVYPARDIKLDREVDIKVLPSALAQDPERLAQFEREAKVLDTQSSEYRVHLRGRGIGRRPWAGDGVSAWDPLLIGTGAVSGDAMLITLVAAQAIAVY